MFRKKIVLYYDLFFIINENIIYTQYNDTNPPLLMYNSIDLFYIYK